MRFAAVVIIAILIASSIGTTSDVGKGVAQIERPIVSQTETITRNWTVQFVLINYNQDYIDTEALLEGFPSERLHDADPISIEYTIEYDLVFASESYEEEVRQFMLDNSINGSDTGTTLDEAALQYQKNNIDEPQRIFYPRDGRSINGTVLENWFAENPYVDPPGLGYMFYLLNFSEFDTSDHELEHWFDYSPMDPDTGEIQNWFRLEWDNALNPDVMFQYPGIGGQHNIYILDPSADQWYLRWARIWWDTITDYEYMSIDLDEKTMSLDLSTQAGVDDLTSYLFEYMYDPVTRLMFPKSPMNQQNDVTAFVDSGYLKCLVIAMDVAEGISIDSLRWVTNADMQKHHLEELFPFIEWEVDVEFLDIDDSPTWTNLFWDYAEVVDGKTIVDGYGMFEAIRNQFRPQYVDVNDENINVFGVVFIKQDMEMHVYGRQYTGLGGGGQTVIWKSWDRYYRSDEVTPKEGISSIQLHETMHAIGLGHIWSTDHYTSDFSRNVMGYYGRFNGTGRYEQNWVQSTYLDQLEGHLILDFNSISPEAGEDVNTRTALAEQKVVSALSLAREFYNSMDWWNCYLELLNAGSWISILSWTIYDDEAPEIIKWGLDGNPALGNTTVWATVLDDLSGVKTVDVHVSFGEGSEYVYPCSYSSGNWTTTIEQIPVDITVRIWVEAQDKGLNIGQSDELTYGNPYLPYNPLTDLLVISSLMIAAIVVIGFVILKKRRVA